MRGFGSVAVGLLLVVRLWGDDVSDAMQTLPFKIEGLKLIDKDALYDALDIERKPAWMFWRRDTPKIKRGIAQKADATLRAFFDSEGFYDANFTMRMGEDEALLRVQEGTPVRITDINISADANISHLIPFKQGDIFRAETFIEVKQAIRDEMLSLGFCSYDLDTKAFVDLKRHEAVLRYLLRKGEPCYFGKTSVAGLQEVDARIVKANVRAKEGMRFSKELVQRTSSAIYGLKAFDSVIIDINRKFYNVVPVDIRVQEMQEPYHIELGAGYDTYVGPRVHATLYKHNFFGNAQLLRLRLAWSKIESLAVVDFDKPVVFEWHDYPINYGLSGGYSDLEFDGFRERKYFVKNFLRFEGERLELTAGLGAEHIEISEIDDEIPLLPPYAYDTFVLFYPYVKAVYDARDSKLNPQNGYYLMGYIEYGLPLQHDASRYMKIEAEARYIATWQKLTAAVVAKAGTIEIYQDSAGGIPESKKFFGGGAFSNRAYGFRELGVITSPVSDLVNGALSMANLSFEADYPIVGKLYGALFTDNTMLAAESYDWSGEIVTSVGVGVRYMTPVGPFKLDVGFNVHDPSQYGIIFQIGQSF